MSAYVEAEINVKDKGCLLKALMTTPNRMGRCWEEDQIEFHQEAVPLIGIGGKQRPETANIVIRRKFVGGAANDIGFKYDAMAGKWTSIISEYDSGWYDQNWVEKLKQNYAVEAVKKQAKRNGYNIQFADSEVEGEIVVYLTN